MRLKEWLEVKDPGIELLNWVVEREQKDLPLKWKALIPMCVDADPNKRISVTTFAREHKKIQVFILPFSFPKGYIEINQYIIFILTCSLSWEKVLMPEAASQIPAYMYYNINLKKTVTI